MGKKKSKNNNKGKSPSPGDSNSIPEQRPPTETEKFLAKILKPFQDCDPETIRLKASKVGNSKDGGIEVMQIVEAAYQAHRVMTIRLQQAEDEQHAEAMSHQAETDAQAEAEYNARQSELEAQENAIGQEGPDE